MQGIIKLAPRVAALVVAASGLAGCASFSPDGGLGVVADITGRTTGKEVASVRTDDDAARLRDATRRLLSRPLSADAAVQVALFNNKGLQAAYHQLALSEADTIEASLPPNPTFSLMRISGDGALEAERQVAGDILALATLPLRSEIARERFRQAQLKAALTTLRLAADVRRAHVRVVAANELVALLGEAQSAAEATAKLAQKLGETGALNRLDQAREQVFYAETTAELATARRMAASARERLIRLMGLWGDDLGFRLPDRLPALPRRPLSQPFVERDAVAHRIDLQIARLELTALATSLQLTEATRFVTLLDLAGLDRKTVEPDGRVIRERGYDVQFQIPVFDGGEVRARQAAETYNIAFNRLTERAVTVRSEARDAYRSYRAAYDIAGHYAREVLPLRQIISEEMQLRYSSMQVDIFALLVEARQRLASRRAAIDAVRDFFLADAELSAAINGGVVSGEDNAQQTASALVPAND
ncbi:MULTISPECIES: TolC family protein [Bradyrhizobium]|jgi:outer membrane protein TolC|uniref:TolC family protein n=7 Tax=Bradyrhizobium TaxID=374 RepID=A0ABS5GH06_9BRAD|nr:MULTISPECIES: TolC family protein [Bradyrhizobium]RTL95355.1 MAG: TolC family protein [Bradyrhizobiaceae bacterium]ABQ38427.1 Putative Outer membrane efflux protein [Bradyrhizobium sp. BTAi1]MBR1140623.1 TolC family protein [Bradyrhizobium denitrificans]MCL8484532.1 TolC family protein [Bradyrhizobium denitrificans]MDU1493125.1 TolC family protein [Bradyrhizobium sp.]